MSSWTEQYRPTHLSNVVGQATIQQFLMKLTQMAHRIDECPHLIFHGPSGTGKTSLALAFARDMYPDVHVAYSTMYLNASDERTMETVRERIRDFLRTSSVGVRRKIVILDEIETMTEPAQLTLRSLMEPSETLHVPLFLFLCNTISRINPLVRSCALSIFCGHLSCSHIQSMLTTVQEAERKPIELPTPLSCMIHRGDMRSFLQKAQMGENPNSWIPWFYRLFNAPDDRVHIVWEEGIQLVPLWLLLRHVLVFCYAVNIYASVPHDVWSEWLTTVVRNRDSVLNLEPIVSAWKKVLSELRKK